VPSGPDLGEVLSRAGMVSRPLAAGVPLFVVGNSAPSASMRLMVRRGKAQFCFDRGVTLACFALRCAIRTSSQRSRKREASKGLLLAVEDLRGAPEHLWRRCQLRMSVK
jgi:hypothetical protein